MKQTVVSVKAPLGTQNHQTSTMTTENQESKKFEIEKIKSELELQIAELWAETSNDVVDSKVEVKVAKANGVYSCPYPKCGYTHQIPSKVRYHMADVCFRKKNVFCIICKKFYSYQALLKHLNHFTSPKNRHETKDEWEKPAHAIISITDTKRYIEAIKNKRKSLFTQ